MTCGVSRGHKLDDRRSVRAGLQQLCIEVVAAQTGRLADPTDLPVTDDLLDEDGMPDPAKVDEAVSRLIEAKPHLASTKPRGDVGQGARSDVADLPGLGSLLRSAAQ